MMKKKYEINDILNAVIDISKIERKKKDLAQTKKDNILIVNTKLKSNSNNALVLDKIIE